MNITAEVAKAVKESRIAEGLVNLFVTGSTAALTTIEFEPGVLSDLKRSLSSSPPGTSPTHMTRSGGTGTGDPM